MAKSLNSPAKPIRSRAVAILLDSLRDSRAEDWYRESWRKAVPDLALATASKDSKVRDGAVTILAMLGPEAEGSLGQLKSLARDTQDTAVRAAAEGAIRAIGFMEGLAAKDAATRIAAAEALGPLGWRAKRALPSLIGAIKDPEVKVRLSAARALQTLGKDAHPAVTDLAAAAKGDAEASVRSASLEALDAIAPATGPVLDAHLGALRDSDPKVRAAAADFAKVPEDDSVLSARRLRSATRMPGSGGRPRPPCRRSCSRGRRCSRRWSPR